MYVCIAVGERAVDRNALSHDARIVRDRSERALLRGERRERVALLEGGQQRRLRLWRGVLLHCHVQEIAQRRKYLTQKILRGVHNLVTREVGLESDVHLEAILLVIVAVRRLSAASIAELHFQSSAHEHDPVELLYGLVRVCEAVKGDKAEHERAVRLSVAVDDAHRRDTRQFVHVIGGDGLREEVVEVLLLAEVRKVPDEELVWIVALAAIARRGLRRHRLNFKNIYRIKIKCTRVWVENRIDREK